MVELTSETKVQRALCADINQAGGYAFKASNAYTTGVPDLSIVPPDMYNGNYKHPCSMKMEVKFDKINSRTRGLTKSLSQPQYDHLKATVKAGGLACWVYAYTFTDQRRWGLFLLHHSLGKSFKMTKAMLDNPDMQGHFIRPLGGSFPVVDICRTVVDAFYEGNHVYANWESQ